MRHFISLFLSLAIGVQPVFAQSLKRVVSADVVEGVVAPLNLVRNSNFSKTSKDWSAYSGSGAQPTGTSGSVLGGDPILVKVSDTSFSPTGFSGSINKTANNTQGSGVLVGLNFLSKYQGKVLTISFDYKLASGTFVNGTPSDLTSAGDSSLTVWVRDVTNSAIIQPSVYRLFDVNTSLAGKFTATFQAPSNSTELQLLFHQARTETSAYNLRIANVVVAEVNGTSGPIVTDLQDYSITIGGSTTAPTLGTHTKKASYKQIGDYAYIKFELSQTSAGSAGSGTYLFPLPPGLTIDSSKLNIGVSGGQVSLGSATGNNGTNLASGFVSSFNSTNLQVYLGNQTDATSVVGSTFYSAANTTYRIGFEAMVPIQGWSSNVQLSSDAGNSVTAFYTTTSASATPNAITKLINSTVITDKSGSYSTVTGEYTAASPGEYEFYAGFLLGTGAANPILYFYKNGVQYGNPFGGTGADNYAASSGKITIPLIAGDKVDYRVISGGTGVQVQNGYSYFGGSKISNHQTIAQADTVLASYENTVAQTLTGGAETRINFATKRFDNLEVVRNASTDFKAVAPTPGIYEINGHLLASAVAGQNGNPFYMYIKKFSASGTLLETKYCYERFYEVAPNAQYVPFVCTPVPFRMLAGEYLQVFALQGSILARTISTSASENWISFKRIGNY